MSKQIEERVVSMQFDNQRFERNVQTSMNTLDKLKQKLNLSGASKGLESVQTAANKVNMSGLANSVETVRTRFSALEVMGVTALANITNSAVNAGKRMISALTIDPVMDGFSEYEMTLNAVQTTMAGTGKTAKEVEKELKKLDEYADKTVYSTADMLNNLPKFTNAGVELETATTAMIGIANATALAGGDANKASIAFYNLGQAIGTGYLTRMDYNSINNAGIATMEWKEAMVEAAIAQGTLTKVGEDSYKAGNKTLTLQQLFIDGLQEQWATTDVMLKVFSDYGDETTTIGKKAYSAAQDIKTFSMMMESLKATAGTGWKDTWQIIFGDLEGAKQFWTGLNNAISSVITKMADWRNTILGGALNLGGIWDTITGKLENSPIGKISKVTETIKNASKDLGYFQKVVNKVWNGDYNNRGDNPDRYDLLEKAGYDHRVVQDLVNKGYQYKLTMNDVEESHKKFGLSMDKTSEKTKETSKAVSKLTEEQLKNAGLTEEEISLYKSLQKEADRLGISIDDLVKNMSKNDGRTLLIDSFKNVWTGISGIFKAIGAAWKEIFNPGGVGELTVKLYGLITSLNNFTKKLRMTDETSNNLKRTFKGLFAIIDIITTIIGGPIKIAFKILTKILGAFNLNILDVTAAIGDAVVKFRDWIDRTLDFTGICKKLTPYLKKAAKAIKEWFAGMKDTEVVKTVSKYIKSAAKSIKEWFVALKDNGVFNSFVEYAKKACRVMKEWFSALKETTLFKTLSAYLKSSAGSIKEWFNGIKEADNIPKYIIQGLVNGLKSGIKMVASIIKELAITILDTIKDILGIHSPSTAFYDIGKNVILGLFNGIKDFIAMIYDLVMSIGGKIIEIVKGFDVGSVITAFVGSGLTLGFIKIASAIEALTEPLDGIGEILQSTAKVIKNFSKVLGSVGNYINAQALKTVAISIAILVGSVALLCLLPVGKVWASIGAIAALALILGGLTVAMGKFGPSTGVQFGKMAGMLLSLATSVLILGIALKIISSIKPESMDQTLTALAHIVIGMIAIMSAFTLLSKKSPAVLGVGAMLLKMAGAIAIMALVVKMFSGMERDAIIKGELAVAGIVGIMALMMLITKIGNFKKVGEMLLKMSSSIAVLALIVKMFSGMERDAIIKGELAVAGIVGIMALMMLITKIGNFKKVGTMLSQLAAAIALLGITVAILGHMDPNAIIQGELAIAGLVAIISGLLLAVKYFGKGGKDIGKTILLISVAIALMAGVAVLLGMVSVENLIKGITAVAVLSALAAGLVAVTKFAGADCYKSMIGIAIAIGVMAAAVAVMTLLDPGKLATATVCISLLIGMLSLLVSATGKANGSIGVLITITIAIGLIGAILYLLAKLPIENTIGSAVALSLVIFAMTGVLYALDKINISIGSALKGVIGLLTLCVPLLAITGILCLMNNANNALTNAMALTLLATALTLLLLPLCAVGVIYAASGGMAALGLLGLLGMCIPLVAIAGILCMVDGLNNAMTNALALTLLINTLGDVCFKLALVGPLALIGVAAVTALTVLIIAVGAFALAVGALMEKFPALQSFLDTGLSVLIQLAGGIGEMIGAFISGALTQIAGTLPAIGLCLSQFMTNAMVFIAGAKLVDEKVLSGVGILAGAILALTVADVINGIATFLNGGSSFAQLGTELSMFMMNAMPFIIGAKMLTPEMTESVKNLAETILILTGAGILEGLTSWFSGGTSLADFGAELAAFGPGMKAFADSVKGIDGESVKAAAEAAKNLAEMTATIPNEGGVVSWFAGENSISKFSTEIVSLGAALKAFSIAVSGIDSESIKAAAEAGKAITDMCSAIPNEGGVVSWFAGENSIAKFSIDLVALGNGLKAFSIAVSGIDIESIKGAAEASRAITDMCSTIPNEGGVVSWFAGDNSISKFGTDLVSLGNGLLGFSNAVSGVNAAAVTSALSAASTIADMVNIIPNEGGIKAWFAGDQSLSNFADHFPVLGAGIKGFSNALDGVSPNNVTVGANAALKIAQMANTIPADSTNLVTFGVNAKLSSVYLKSFFKNIGTISADNIFTAIKAFTSIRTISESLNPDSISSSAKAIKEMANTVKGLSKIKATAADGFSIAIKKLGEVNIDNMLKAFSGAEDKMEASGKNLISKFISGVNGQKDKIIESAKTVASKFVSGIKSKDSAVKETSKNLAKIAASGIIESKASFELAGQYLGLGLAKGIAAKETEVYNAAYRLGQKAVQGEKDGQKSNSPSKLTILAGKWLGEGLAIGIERMSKVVYNSSYGLGETATRTISSAVSNISDIVNSDIDSQPTIRPVLDLSDIRNGAGSINALFSGRTLAVDMAGVGSVSASMAGFQNGNNYKEIVSGIKALRKDIADMPRNTYTVNGITYDDGTNISDAVGALVRAARIERRT